MLTKWESGGRVHRGFAQALLATWPLISHAPRASNRRSCSRAIVLGLHLPPWRPARLPTRAYTFGSPRVGDVAFTNTLAGVDVQRYVDCCDIVCRIPPESFEYRHVGTVQYINRDGVRKTNPTVEKSM